MKRTALLALLMVSTIAVAEERRSGRRAPAEAAPFSVVEKTSRRPSGDQLGLDSVPGPSPSRVCPEPSVCMT